MIINFFRILLASLSFFHKNNLELVKKRDKRILKNIRSKLNTFSKKNNSLKKTHKIFRKKILFLLNNGNLYNFLRNNFIQKMFFVHNRFFILKELNILKKNKNWEFYKKIIKEDNVGDPIRYFLYPKSSGNKINHVYHLNILSSEFNVNLKKIKKVFEFGGGYGCMARIFSKINNNVSYICFDTNYVNLLQYYYLKQNNLNVGFSKKNKFYLISDLKNKKQYLTSKITKYLFIANWSLSETPIKFRENFFDIIKNSHYILISFQEKFEEVDNLKYFKNMQKKLCRTFKIKIVSNEFYKGNIFNYQKHYFLVGKRL
tara:strand:- start:1079 stop:2023 length:945 start_codon:yes stop_codon:yes gene_type:complete